MGQKITQDDIDHRFTYHPPTGDQPALYTELRDRFRSLAQLVREVTPGGREQSLAITHLEQAVMWANAGIARGERP